MTWLRLDDDFPDHPRIIGLSDTAFRTYVTGLCYCGRHLTDGDIPTGALRAIGPRRAAQELEAAGLWLRTDHGWAVRDYLHYQASRADVEAEKERKRTAGRAGGLRKAENIRRRTG